MVGLWILGACSKAPPVQMPAPATGPNILTVQELDQDRGKNLLVERSGIADINSSLEVRIDSTALRQRVSKLVGTSKVPTAVIDRLAVLQKMAITRLDQVQKYGKALEKYSTFKKPEDLKAVRDAIEPLAQDVSSLIEVAEADPELGQRLESRLKTFFADERHDVASQYDAILAFAGDEAADARQALDLESRQAGVRIQVGTWLSTSQGVRPIHTTGLDQTEPSSPFVVDRWTVVLDDKQKREIQTLAVLAQAANTGGFSGLVSKLLETSRRTFELMSDQATKCAKTLTTAKDAITGNAGTTPPASTSNLLTALQGHIKTLQKSATDLRALAAKYQEAPSTTDAAAFLIATNEDLESVKTIYQTVTSTVTQIENSLTGLPALPQTGNLANGASGLKNELDLCVATIKDALDGLGAGIAGINHAEQIRALAEDAWKEVLSFDVADLPSTSTLQLVSAGPRRAGDLVLIRVATTRGSDAKREIIDEQQVTLQRVLPHLELSVGLVFADPLGTSSVVHRFQAAPAYSVLYRRGSRRSTARNTFWNVGLGINVAAVDFDKDDVPELGLGLTASAFADLIQAGAGYNVFLDRAYWFFGVRLPVGILSLAGNRTPVSTDTPVNDQ